MNYEIYRSLEITDDFSVIDFISTGKKGNIPKRIIFQATEWTNVYNLAFGDMNKDGEIDDSSISNNGDRNKILATLVSVVKDYTKRYPERVISFSGSTIQRTRLYRIAISLNYPELSDEFEIYSLIDELITPFSANIKATAFL